MRKSLADLCVSFIENRDIIKSSLSMESSYLYPVCAGIYTDMRKTADGIKIKYCSNLLKREIGAFSYFRGAAKPALICMLAASDDPEARLEASIAVYDALKEHFSSSAYLPLTSMIISSLSQPYQYRFITEQANGIYMKMKREHPILTSSEDSVFAALLSYTEQSDDYIIHDCEVCYDYLKAEFPSNNAVQSLCHVLSLYNVPPEWKCRRVVDLYNVLREHGHKYGTGFELPTLGTLSLLPADIDEIVTAVSEVDDFLSMKRGYGFFGLGKKQRLMHAGMLVSSDYNINSVSAIDIQSGALSVIAAQQAALCAAVAAACAAAASASASASS